MHSSNSSAGSREQRKDECKLVVRKDECKLVRCNRPVALNDGQEKKFYWVLKVSLWVLDRLKKKCSKNHSSRFACERFATARMMVSVRARAAQCRALCTVDQGVDSHPRILHEAPEWLVIHKPAGWHSVGAGGAGRRRGQLGCSLERASADALEEQRPEVE